MEGSRDEVCCSSHDPRAWRHRGGADASFVIAFDQPGSSARAGIGAIQRAVHGPFGGNAADDCARFAAHDWPDDHRDEWAGLDAAVRVWHDAAGQSVLFVLVLFLQQSARLPVLFADDVVHDYRRRSRPETKAISPPV
jgi:hypothetical protein